MKWIGCLLVTILFVASVNSTVGQEPAARDTKAKPSAKKAARVYPLGPD
jgi:hypothetical protein